MVRGKVVDRKEDVRRVQVCVRQLEPGPDSDLGKQQEGADLKNITGKNRKS